jgi:hypothetical protein
MTREEFIDVLDRKRYFYEIEGDKIVVTHRDVNLSYITSLPNGVVFNNEGSVNLYSLTHIPSNVEFKNEGNVYLGYLTSIPPGVEFKNEGNVWFDSLIDNWFFAWKGNIEGIDNKRLLNLMISKRMFI